MSNTAKEEEEAKARAKEEEGGTADKNVCTNCGIAAVDNIKLEECTDCDLVKYCSGKCREEHREQHEEHCKKRKAELYDKELFTQPDGTHLGECPLCFLPLSLDPTKSGFYTCCSNTVCQGCINAHLMANEYDEKKALSCPFCREPANDDENDKRMKKRIKANDPVAMNEMGKKLCAEGDYEGELKYYTKAAELGDIDSHYQLGCTYEFGEVVEKDDDKAVYHFEKAAIGGHPGARNNLGYYEEENGNMERAAKHYIIAANLGLKESMKALWGAFKFGHITKKHYRFQVITKISTEGLIF